MKARWLCVTCNAQAEPGTLWAVGWLDLPGGRVCQGCREKFEAAPVGAYADVGGGVKVVKAGEGKPDERAVVQ